MRTFLSPKPRPFGPLIAASLLLGGCVNSASAQVQPVRQIETPTVADPGLEIVLVADSSKIVHPIGIAWDSTGRLLAIESHTHFPPDEYQGGKHDRILALSDRDRDGSLETVETFFEGAKHTMDICVHFNGAVYVATRNEILRLEDRDKDGRAEVKRRIAFLDTKGSYPHNGLSGLHVDFDGNLIFGMGENLGVAYQLRGSDGTTIADEAEGGNVFCCTADGEKLRRVATGFWNPFGVCRDVFGNLFAIDNDPSANGCRLVHVIEGGNYGYHYRYGRSGLHPFIAWRGELPGTLPMVCPTGEAPCELIAYQANGLPQYRNSLLSACWSEHQIQQYKLRPEGSSFRAERLVAVQGSDDFRPVGIAVKPDGSLLISDWVKRDYKLHGFGRIWHLRPRAPVAVEAATDLGKNRALRESQARIWLGEGRVERLQEWFRPDQEPVVVATAIEALGASSGGRLELEKLAMMREAAPPLRAQAIRRLKQAPPPLKPMFPPRFASLVADEQQPMAVRREAVSSLQTAKEIDLLLSVLYSKDPFMRSAAIHQIATYAPLLEALPKSHSDPRIRVQLLLARRRGGVQHELVIPAALADQDEQVRFMGLKWIADEKLEAYREDVASLLDASGTSARLFVAAATALARLDGRSGDEAKVFADLRPRLADRDTADAAKVMILRGIPAPGEVRRGKHVDVAENTIKQLLNSESLALRRETVRFRAGGASAAQAKRLAALANDKEQDIELRRDAVLALAPHVQEFRDQLLSWALDGDCGVQRAALQSLVGAELSERQRTQLDQLANVGGDSGRLADRSELKQAVDRILQRPVREPRWNSDLEYWAGWLGEAGKGDPEAGRRVFLHSRLAKCSSCHQAGGRGSMVGPDLSRIADQSSARKIIESIINPSKNVAPHYTAWKILTDDGKVRTGFLLFQTEKDQTFLDQQSQQITLKNEEIESAEPSRTSIMPQGLLGLLTNQEVVDLLAFLSVVK